MCLHVRRRCMCPPTDLAYYSMIHWGRRQAGLHHCPTMPACKPGEPSLTVKPNSLFSNNNQPQQPTTTQQQQPIDLNHSFLRISLFCSVRKPFPAQGGGPPRNTKRDVFETVWYRSDSVYAVSTASSRLRNRKQHCLITDGLCLPVGQIVMAHKACSFKTQSLNGTKHMDEETTTSPNGGYSYHDTLQTG